jgi:hypothetical protein
MLQGLLLVTGQQFAGSFMCFPFGEEMVGLGFQPPIAWGVTKMSLLRSFAARRFHPGQDP